MEFWIDDERYEIVLGPTLTGDSVTTLFSKTLKEGNGFLSVLQIYAGDSVLELLFDSTTRSPVRLALGFPNLALEPLLEMFSTFHKNDVIREQPRVSFQAFSPSSLGFLGDFVRVGG